MRKALLFLAFLLLCNFILSKVLTIKFEITRNNVISNIEYFLEEGRGKFILPGPYRAELVDENNRVVSKVNFNVNFVIFTDPPRELDKTLVWLNIRYNESARKLRIYYENNILKEVKLVLCDHDGKCEEFENTLSCADCPSGAQDGFCDGILDFKCDPDCEPQFDIDCSQLPLIGFVIVVIGICFIVVYFAHVKKRKII